jgi:hypothetical protein
MRCWYEICGPHFANRCWYLMTLSRHRGARVLGLRPSTIMHTDWNFDHRLRHNWMNGAPLSFLTSKPVTNGWEPCFNTTIFGHSLRRKLPTFAIQFFHRSTWIRQGSRHKHYFLEFEHILQRGYARVVGRAQCRSFSEFTRRCIHFQIGHILRCICANVLMRQHHHSLRRGCVKLAVSHIKIARSVHRI